VTIDAGLLVDCDTAASLLIAELRGSAHGSSVSDYRPLHVRGQKPLHDRRIRHVCRHVIGARIGSRQAQHEGDHDCRDKSPHEPHVCLRSLQKYRDPAACSCACNNSLSFITAWKGVVWPDAKPRLAAISRSLVVRRCRAPFAAWASGVTRPKRWKELIGLSKAGCCEGWHQARADTDALAECAHRCPHRGAILKTKRSLRRDQIGPA
jgi:hypothetical protein